MDPDDGADPEELDRVVSRDVRHPTEATASDERSYQAAQHDDPAPAAAPEHGSETGGAAERAARDGDHDDEPTRSE